MLVVRNDKQQEQKKNINIDSSSLVQRALTTLSELSRMPSRTNSPRRRLARQQILFCPRLIQRNESFDAN